VVPTTIFTFAGGHGGHAENVAPGRAAAPVPGPLVVLAAVTVAEGNRAGLHILATSNQGEGHLFLRGVTDLLAETVVR